MQSQQTQTKLILLELPVFLCDKHLQVHKYSDFVIKYCSGWSFVAIPTRKHSNSCSECNGFIKPIAYLSRADLSGADLSGADLSGADLSGADLSGADLSGADLSRADLFGANLSGANLSGADLFGANLSGANLSGAYLSGAYLSRAYLSGASLYKAIYSKNTIFGEGFQNSDEFKKMILV